MMLGHIETLFADQGSESFPEDGYAFLSAKRPTADSEGSKPDKLGSSRKAGYAQLAIMREPDFPIASCCMGFR